MGVPTLVLQNGAFPENQKINLQWVAEGAISDPTLGQKLAQNGGPKVVPFLGPKFGARF